MHIVNTMSILSWRANTTAPNRSDTVPTNASTTAPRNTGDNPSCGEACSSAADTPFGLAARCVAGKHVTVGHECIDQVGGVEQQQDNRDTKAQPLVDQGG